MQQLINLILSLFFPKVKPEPTSANLPAKETPIKETKVEINWLDPKAKVSKYFTVKEALWLPSWNCLHSPTEEEKANIIKMGAKMDIVREFLGKPINTHCWLRPGKVNCSTFDPKTIKTNDPIKQAALDALDYNAFVKGAKRSAHKFALGVDFDCGEDCSETRKKLLAKLEAFDMRMEDIEGPWVHLDIYPKETSGGVRFFKP